jgi:hypothetical protein
LIGEEGKERASISVKDFHGTLRKSKIVDVNDDQRAKWAASCMHVLYQLRCL